MPHGELIDVVLLTLLAFTAVTIARLRNLLSTAMLAGIFSLLGASWMLFLDAPDVAFTEAAVGAGVSTILFFAALCVTPAEEKPSRESPLGLVVVVVTGAVLIYGTLDMPHQGDPNSPANRNPVTSLYLHSATPPEDHGPAHAGDGHEAISIRSGWNPDTYAVGIPNTVTTVLASFRGYDTMGETAVVFTAGLGVLVILGGARHRRFRSPDEVAPDEGAADTNADGEDRP